MHCTKQDTADVPPDALRVRGHNGVYIRDCSGEYSLLDPGKIGALDMSLWMDNNSIEDAISDISKVGRDPLDLKQYGIYALVGIVAIYLVYVFMT